MNNPKYPVRAALHKEGDMIYFSQLDIFNLLKRALRRTSLPIYFTQGFNPHSKISFLTGLKLGVEGTIETVFYFSENITFEKLKEELTRQLPQGLKIIEASK